jgi:hypothetical protein
LHPEEFWWLYEAKMPPEQRQDKMEQVYQAYIKALAQQQKKG